MNFDEIVHEYFISLYIDQTFSLLLSFFLHERRKEKGLKPVKHESPEYENDVYSYSKPTLDIDVHTLDLYDKKLICSLIGYECRRI